MAVYAATIVSFEPRPVISFQDGSSVYAQAFNPSWVASSAGSGGQDGLLVRVQNCSVAEPGVCSACSGAGSRASRLAFVQPTGRRRSLPLETNASSPQPPRFERIVESSVVFGPHDNTDNYGTEDPRLVFDPTTGVYHLFYTSYNSGHAAGFPRVSLCHASALNPTLSDGWSRHGSVGLGENSKSGAVLLGHDRTAPHRGEHLLFWGSGTIRVSRSRNLSAWDRGEVFLTNTSWGNPHVESGPPPMRLSTGDYIAFINSWSASFPRPPGYQPGWVVLRGSDPTKIVAQAAKPLWSPERAPWMMGAAPALCNVPNVAFVEACVPTGRRPDEFRLFFGGADAVVGSAVVRIELIAAS